MSRASVAFGAEVLILLGSTSPWISSNLPGGSGGQPSNASICGFASGVVYRAAPVTRSAVGSYSTVSPLPPDARACGGGLRFLWHFPQDCSYRALPGTLPCEARTFLPRGVGPSPTNTCPSTTSTSLAYLLPLVTAASKPSLWQPLLSWLRPCDP